MNLLTTFIFAIFATISRFDSSHTAEGLSIFDFLTSSTAEKAQNISFSPDDGKKFRTSFERKYGPKGRHLIESMGQGESRFLPQVTVNEKQNSTKNVIKIKKKVVTTTSTKKPTTQ